MKGSLKWDTEGKEDADGMFICSGSNAGKTDLELLGVCNDVEACRGRIHVRRVESRLIRGSSAGASPED